MLIAPRYTDRVFQLIHELDGRASLAEMVRRIGAATAAEQLVRPGPPHVRRLVALQRRRRADDWEVLQEAVAALLDLTVGQLAGYHILRRIDRARERVEERERRSLML